MPHNERQTMSVEYNVPAVMRDGVTLFADVYRPDRDEDVPVLLMRHPYSKQRTPMLREVDVRRVVNSGYIVVMQDVRGRYTSEGTFDSNISEIDDGADSVAWVAGLAGGNGIVGMWGSSYAAATQWQALLGGADLRSIVPINSPGHTDFLGFLMRGGAIEFGNRISWWHRAISFGEMGRTYPECSLAELFASFEANQRMLDTGEVYRLRPFNDEVSERMGEVYARGMQVLTNEPGALVHTATSTSGKYEQLDVPSFHTGGWFDCFLGETLAQYRGMSASAAGKGVRQPHLMIGPWPHGSSDYRLGDVTFGLQARATLPVQDAPLTDQIIRWFDATLKGRESALDGIPPVRLYLMGSNTWLGLDSYPPAASERQTWYLAENGALTLAVPQAESSVSFAYDPDDPVPTLGGPILLAAEFPAGPCEQNRLYDRSDIVSFEGDPLAEDLHVIGNVTATLHVSTDAADTDFVVSLCDVDPQGRSILLVNGIVRLSERERFTPAGEFVDGTIAPVAGEDIRVEVNLLDTAHTFRAGHRLRVDITSSSFPRWDPNPNTGRTIFDSAETAVAQQTVRFGGTALSSLSVPVVDDDTVRGSRLHVSQNNDISNGWED